MRALLLSWLPQDLSGRRILDAGCGTGMLAIEAARRGADVVGIDVSPQLVAIGRERLPDDVKARIRLEAGDMLDERLGEFDHIVSMDVLIHYEADQIADACARLAERARESMVFTFAPGTPLLRTARAIGRFFPRSDRSPAIIPVGHGYLKARMSRIGNARLGRDARVSRGFYTSHAQEVLVR
jgi:magnesium-protoporphyrin O-methyltransferase